MKISFNIIFLLFLVNSLQSQIVRGPYLQMGTHNSVVIRWRTANSEDTKVNYGLSVSNLNLSVSNPSLVTEHEIAIFNLQPDTKYFYSFGSTTNTSNGQGDTTFYIKTQPILGSTDKLRIWAIGDAGNDSQNQRDVRDAMHNVSNHINAWLLLGDNAYENGTDSEYQTTFFNVYTLALRNTFLYPSLGNHDYANNPFASTAPYFNFFTLPTNGEIGGLASGTEKYYSYNIGNVHFISLDSYRSSRTATGDVANWLKQDLQQNTQKFTIIYFHHPPYTKGSHDSDSFLDFECGDMRSNLVPIFEDYGVDLVLSGHSHCYERSFLLNNHYGNSSSFNNSMKKDATGGHWPANCPYKKVQGPHNGTVYAVVGCSGKTSSTGNINHPAMYYSTKTTLGSLIIDVEGDQLSAIFLTSNQTVADSFTIFKRNTNTFYHTIQSGQSLNLKAGWSNDGYNWSTAQTTREITINPNQNDTFIVQSSNSCLIDTHVVIISTNLDKNIPNNWKIYPNPVENQLNISVNENIEMELYDILGRKITIEPKKVKQFEYQIDMSKLEIGSYFLKFTTKDKVYSKTILKE